MEAFRKSYNHESESKNLTKADFKTLQLPINPPIENQNQFPEMNRQKKDNECGHVSKNMSKTFPECYPTVQCSDSSSISGELLIQKSEKFSITSDFDLSHQIKSALLGLSIGDALGVPVEFNSRERLKWNPIVDMVGYGTYNQKPGTWSDDSSLTFCLAEALTKGYDLNAISTNFLLWYHENFWTARGEVFDIGISTRKALYLLKSGVQPDLAGGFTIDSNGNGSLMRILPLMFYITGMDIGNRFRIIRKVSSITHAHIRSVIACFYYVEYALQLASGNDKLRAYNNTKKLVRDYLVSISIPFEEIAHFDRLLIHDIHQLPEEQIQSSGYVLHTLESGIWCLLTTDNFKEAVLKAVNLGEDTDTTAAVTGGLAGILYGAENIPQDWLHQLARYEDIIDLSIRLSSILSAAESKNH